MFNPTAYENSTPDGISVLEVWPGPEEPGEKHRRFVPLQRTELSGEVTGPVASLRLVQLFRYSREQCDRVLEALYRFPLPGDAAVTGVQVRFGQVEIVTELKERPDAEAEYEKAREEGRQAALLTRESPDVFTLRVAGLQPDQDVTVETSYVQLARPEGQGWSLRLPLTTAPRYVRSDEVTAPHAHGQPLALVRDPGHRFTLDLMVSGAGAVSSPTHAVDVTTAEDRTLVRLRDGEVVPDRDCVLTWEPGQEQRTPSFQVWLHNDPAGEELYFLAMVAPPAMAEPGQGVPREVVLLVDHSGSMEGAKWVAADWAVKRFLSDLNERDRFNLALFHNTTRWFSAAPRPADAGAAEEASRFLEAHRDSGGTELGVALEQALNQERVPGDLARHVLIITDAQVTDASRILRLADQEATRSDRRRISLLCIDAAPNDFLAQELAERGGGAARFLTSDPQQEDITTALDEVLADWAQPVLAGLQLEVDRGGVRAAGRQVREGDPDEVSCVDLGDLPMGRAIWVGGSAPRGASAGIGFRVLEASGREVKSRRLGLSSDANQRPALKALFGARRILGLEYLVHSGYSGDELAGELRRLGYDPAVALAAQPASPPKVYAENARADAHAALRALLVRESRSFGLISSETAFVAVRKEAGKTVEATAVIPNALPAGWSERFFGGSATFYGSARPAGTGFARALFLASPTISLAVADGTDMSPAAMPPMVPSQVSQPARSVAKPAVLFAGVPAFVDGQAILFDSTSGSDPLADTGLLTRVELRFPGGTPDSLDPGLCLLIFVDDLSNTRARVRLVDMIRLGGQRPLNINRQSGQRVQVVLVDPSGAWAVGAPAIEVALG